MSKKTFIKTNIETILSIKRLAWKYDKHTNEILEMLIDCSKDFNKVTTKLKKNTLNLKISLKKYNFPINYRVLVIILYRKEKDMLFLVRRDIIDKLKVLAKEYKLHISEVINVLVKYFESNCVNKYKDKEVKRNYDFLY